MKRLLLAAALALASLTGCGGDAVPDATTYVATAGTASSPGTVEEQEAPAIDLDAYGEDLAAIYEAAGITNCEPGLSDRDIAGALYLDCDDAPVDVRMYPDVEAAVEGALWDIEVQGGASYRVGRVVVHADSTEALDEFRSHF